MTFSLSAEDLKIIADAEVAKALAWADLVKEAEAEAQKASTSNVRQPVAPKV